MGLRFPPTPLRQKEFSSWTRCYIGCSLRGIKRKTGDGSGSCYKFSKKFRQAAFVRSFLRTSSFRYDSLVSSLGCIAAQTLFKVSIQMVMPGLIAVSIVSFLHTWNMFAAPLVLTYTLKSKPLTVTMTEFIGQYFVHWDLMSAATMISIIPPLIIVIFFQKYIIQGLSAGAIK